MGFKAGKQQHEVGNGLESSEAVTQALSEAGKGLQARPGGREKELQPADGHQRRRETQRCPGFWLGGQGEGG